MNGFKKLRKIAVHYKKIKITRNHQVHLKEEHKEKSFTTKELIETNKVLEFVIREFLLREIGINNFE